jgi:hypothetical protein
MTELLQAGSLRLIRQPTPEPKKAARTKGQSSFLSELEATKVRPFNFSSLQISDFPVCRVGKFEKWSEVFSFSRSGFA